MSTQSVTACPPLKWPADLGTIGLREEDVRIYNAAIPLIVPHVPPGGYSVLERQITLPPWRAANPRRVLLNNGTFILLVLNRKGGVPTTAGGASQKPMKLAFDLVSGKPCLKKTIGSIAEEMLVRLICKYKIKGFAEIVCVERRKGGKVIYFEIKSEQTFTQYCRGVVPGELRKEFDFASLIAMQNGLKILHETIYHPPVLQLPDKSCSERPPFRCFLGDISPHNCVIEENEQGHLVPQLIDYGGACDPEHFLCWPGWDPPETVGLFGTRNYNLTCATKKDVWQFGLLMGSLLRSGLLVLNGRVIPAFSFIRDHLTVQNGEIDPSGLKNLTQKEIDDKIAQLIKEEQSPDRQRLWKVVNLWLTIDPAKRPSIAEAYCE